MIVAYVPTNSGGSRWISDRHWECLRKAGWEIVHFDGMKRKPVQEARLECSSIEEAKLSFIEATGIEDINNPGCECCGQPHYFVVVAV